MGLRTGIDGSGELKFFCFYQVSNPERSSPLQMATPIAHSRTLTPTLMLILCHSNYTLLGFLLFPQMKISFTKRRQVSRCLAPALFQDSNTTTVRNTVLQLGHTVSNELYRQRHENVKPRNLRYATHFINFQILQTKWDQGGKLKKVKIDGACGTHGTEL